MVPAHIYVHGSGRQGQSAWPHVDDERAVFVTLDPQSSIEAQTERLVHDYAGRDALFFAHSIGAVPVALAAERLGARGLVLIEPALYDIARGEAAIERHIGIVTEARARASEGDLRGCWAILRPLMFGGPFDAARWEDERAMAEHWASINLPWGHGVRERMLDGIPTLIVTGGWNNEYELIAERLAVRGAERAVLPGAQHRPHDLPGFPALVERFQAERARR